MMKPSLKGETVKPGALVELRRETITVGPIRPWPAGTPLVVVAVVGTKKTSARVMFPNSQIRTLEFLHLCEVDNKMTKQQFKVGDLVEVNIPMGLVGGQREYNTYRCLLMRQYQRGGATDRREFLWWDVLSLDGQELTAWEGRMTLLSGADK